MVGNGNANGVSFNKYINAIKPIAWYDVKKQGCTNENLSKTYNYETDGWYNGTDDIINCTLVNDPNYVCTRIEVKKGEEFKIKTYGTVNAKAWILTDKNMRILSRSIQNLDCRDTPADITVDNDGYLCVNCQKASYNISNCYTSVIPVLIDLSGNGHNLTLNNFAFSGMSGVGGYNTDFKKNWHKGTAGTVSEINNNSFIITSMIGNTATSIFYTTSEITKLKFKVTELNGASIIIRSRIPSAELLIITQDGTYEINNSNGFNFMSDTQKDLCNIKIEQLPEYPDALVFDGVDDNAICTNMPILDDFTFIYNAKKLNNTIVDGNIEVYGIAFSKRSNGYEVNGAFVFSKRYNRAESIYNYGIGTNIETIIEDGINYVKKGIFNDKTINVGTLSDSNNFMIGSLFPTYEYGNMVFYSCALFGKSLTDTQIKDWIRKNIDEDYLLPSERPKPNIYYDFRNGDNSNLTTVTDLSGNERHGTMYNFTGEADSGYSNGCLKFNGIDNYIQIPYSDDAVYKTVILLVRPSMSKGANMLYDGRYLSELTTGIALLYGGENSDYLSDRLSDNAKVYINGVINTSYTNTDMNNKKNCVAVSDDVPYSGNLGGPPNIGTVRFTPNWFAYMELYAFLGFDKILTEEEIKYVMNKYNLLEDVDELII